VALLRSGATLAAAAGAAEVSVRTVRDWLARGEDRHPSRSSTPKLRRFARRVRQAMAEARTLAENRLFEQDPKAWLRGTARATPDDEGWSDAPSRGKPAGPIGLSLQSLSDEEIDEALWRLRLALDEVLVERRPLGSVSANRPRRASA